MHSRKIFQSSRMGKSLLLHMCSKHPWAISAVLTGLGGCVTTGPSTSALKLLPGWVWSWNRLLLSGHGLCLSLPVCSALSRDQRRWEVGLGDTDSGAGVPGASCGTDRRGACSQGRLGKLTTAFRQAPLKFRLSSCFPCRDQRSEEQGETRARRGSESILEKG